VRTVGQRDVVDGASLMGGAFVGQPAGLWDRAQRPVLGKNAPDVERQVLGELGLRPSRPQLSTARRRIVLNETFRVINYAPPKSVGANN
jgi:hypothetical protein